ncbi:fluoride efflux transporter FluC (plasmid) [Coraliomargarita sp. W4R53]
MTAVEHPRDSGRRSQKPEFVRPRLMLFVLVGGAIGAAGREGIALALPSQGGIPWAVLIVNTCGAFLLGFLLTALGSREPETPGRRDLRLFAGTGILGGFTTYSSFATDTAVLFATNSLLATAFAIVSVIVGIVVAAAGVMIAHAVFRFRGTTS